MSPTHLSWIDRLTIVGSILLLTTFIWTLHRDHVADAKESAKEYREYMNRHDQEWKALLAKFHDHDKDLHTMKNPRGNNSQ